ncbi:MAG: phosphatidate cytidylyltransferase [Calditrichaeota bacterium]|nr:MAG: phosphatidate cytidylyltransferase [Calditrichota bacterium]
MALSNLANRVIVAVVGGPLIIACVWFGGWYYFGLMLLLTMVGGNEFINFTKKKGMDPNWLLTLASFPALFTLIFLNLTHYLLEYFAAYTVLLLLFELMRKENNSIFNVSAALLTTVYLGVLFGFLLDLRNLPVEFGFSERTGAVLVFLVFLATWICDTGAYLAGKNFGRHKLAPRISPNKTIEGAVGGITGALLTAIVCQYYFNTSLQMHHAVIIALLIGVFGQLSDLVESLFKRDAGVKDSSAILPGHGGILDRFDSELLSVPLIYIYIKYFIYAAI